MLGKLLLLSLLQPGEWAYLIEARRLPLLAHPLRHPDRRVWEGHLLPTLPKFPFRKRIMWECQIEMRGCTYWKMHEWQECGHVLAIHYVCCRRNSWPWMFRTLISISTGTELEEGYEYASIKCNQFTGHAGRSEYLETLFQNWPIKLCSHKMLN